MSLVIRKNERAYAWITHKEGDQYYIAYVANFEFSDKDSEIFKMNDIDLLDMLIKDWRNIEDEKGKPIECNKETKKLWAYKCPDRWRFILTECQNFVNFGLPNKDQEIKN